MEFKGTKGKWSVSAEYHYYNGSKALEINYGEDGECVAEIVHDSYDAKLISKAPEMLEALSRLLELTKEMEKRIIDIEKLSYADPKFLAEIQQLIKEATTI